MKNLPELNNLLMGEILHFFPQGLVAIDLEMTGLSPLSDRIIEVAGIKLDPDLELTSFQTLVNPQVEIDAKNQAIHQISNDMVENERLIETVLPLFWEFVGDLPLVAHNAIFDLGFIISSSMRHQIPLPKKDIFCSVKLSRSVFKDVKNYKLPTLAQHLNIPLENHHRAMDDTFACLALFANGLSHLKRDKEQLHKSHIFNLKNFDIAKAKNHELPKKLSSYVPLVREQEIFKIKYTSGSISKNKLRPIRPLGFLPMPKGPVLYAQCLLSGQFKYFSLNKISALERCDEDELKKWNQVQQDYSNKINRKETNES